MYKLRYVLPVKVLSGLIFVVCVFPVLVVVWLFKKIRRMKTLNKK